MAPVSYTHLDVYKRQDEDMEALKRTMKQGEINGAEGLEIIDEKRLHELSLIHIFCRYCRETASGCVQK